ncbi:hypothetical protein KFL_009120010, partial [Klebsormidium nitens]
MTEMRQTLETKIYDQKQRIDAQAEEIAGLKSELAQARTEMSKLDRQTGEFGKTVENFGKVVQEKVFPIQSAAPLQSAEVVEEVRRTVSAVVEERVWETVERKSRGCTLRITGLEESQEGPPVLEQVIQLVSEKMKMPNAKDLIQSASRIGKRREDGRPQVVLARCISEQARRQILMRKPNLKGCRIGVDEDRTPVQQAQHYSMVKLMREARAQKKHARIMGGRLFVDGAVQSKVEEVPLAGATRASESGEGVRQTRERSEVLEAPIKEGEVEAALKCLKNGKSADLKGFTAELLKAGQKQLVAGLTSVFNRVFEEGVFPEDWNEGVLVAIFKKGYPSDYGNYRTVTVGPVLGKLFATVINRRLTEWAEKGSIRAKGQAGFRKGFRATDHLLALRVLIEKWGRGRDRHLFACFVDFRKAFDLVPRDKLWQRLKELGVGVKMLQSVRSMYTDVRCRVRGDGWISEESFQSNSGVKQGCPLSPLLFGLYTDGLEDSMRGRGDPTLMGVGVPLLAP